MMNKDKGDMVNIPDNIDPVKIDDSIKLLKNTWMNPVSRK